MAIAKVTKIDQTKTGKTRVYLDGKHNWSDAFYLGQRTECPPLNETIEANTSSKTFEDGKTIWFLNAFRTVKVAETPPKTQTSHPMNNGLINVGLPIVNPGSWAIDYGDCSRFVSNVVGSAIEAKLIGKPSDIHPWISAAYNAVQGLRAGKPVEFDDIDSVKWDVTPESARDAGDPGPDVEF